MAFVTARPAPVRADDPPEAKIVFHLPADTAEKSLRKFSAQSGLEVIFPTEITRGLNSPAVEGELTPHSAIDQVLAGTGLVARQDAKTGAFTISRQPDSSSGSPPTPNPPVGSTGPAPGRASLPATGEQTVKLNPFEVQATHSNSYAAMNSNSLTAFSVPLDRLPETADIIDRAFLDDVGALDMESTIAAYDAGASFAPQDNGGAASTAAWGHGQPGDISGNNPTIFLRGFPVEGILTNGAQLNFGNEGQTGFEMTSNYDLDRIEIIDGPQALMYSGSGPGGAVNIVTKQAYLGQPASGELSMRFDQYGSKYATFDYGTGTDHFAARVALVDGTNDSRRVNITNSLQGAYVQLAAKLGNTVIRATVQQSIFSGPASNYLSLTSSGDPNYSQVNGYRLETLLFSPQLAPPLIGGALNWNNVESFITSANVYSDVAETATIEADSTWTSWLSSKVQVGGANLGVDRGNQETYALYSPAASANPLPGNWTETSANLGDANTTHKNRTLSGILLMTNDLFGGRVKSKTSFEADYESNVDVNNQSYQYYQADANWNVLVNPAIATNSGRTPFPTVAWTVNSGPKYYQLPTIAYGANSGQRLTYNGVNYVRQQDLLYNPLTAGYGWTYVKYNDAGYSLINDMEMMGGKLDSLVGIRLDHVNILEPNSPTIDAQMRKPDFSVGLVYHLTPWLAPYVNASNIWQPKVNAQNYNITADNGDPAAYSFEAGVKINADDGKLSGSLSAYHSYMHDDNVAPNAIAAGDVDPNGLNGVYGTAISPLAADVTSYGITAALSAMPTQNWRMRLSAAWTSGSYTGGVTAPQYYNDQFFENSSGQVTYADGSVVYVPATFNKSQLTVPSTTAGAVPLTVTLLSTPSSQYYANPAPITGAISKTSNGGLVLLNGALATGGTTGHGSILTGATGLPMSQYQLNTSLSGIVPTGGFDLDIPNEQTFGYPAISFNFTSVYEVSEGPLKGLSLGGTATVNWRYFIYDWYGNANDLTPNDLHEFYLPTMPTFNLISGYNHKFGRVLWSIQLNVNNLFNTYKVVEYPYILGGYSLPTNLIANLVGQPRQYILTTRLKF